MRSPIAILIAVAFLISSVMGPMPQARADDFYLPVPGVMVYLSPAYEPPMLKGIKVHTDNPFRFDFILDKGEGRLSQDALKDESSKLIRYFLASLTIPEKELWVNLSPYEKQRIIPQSFGLTEMGRDLLVEDYMLKQITASLIYPEDGIGKRFWGRVYEEAFKRFGTTNIPVNTFNKVWIVPEKAVVYENSKAGTAYVVESKLKVMLEQDYLAMLKDVTPTRGHVPEGYVSPSTLPSDVGLNAKATQRGSLNALGSQIIREIIIPELAREVNEDKNFAHLRQVYNSLILATWYKSKIKDSILSKVYEDKKKVAGVGPEVSLRGPSPGQASRTDVQYIYQRYLQAFKKGVYNYIKEEADPLTLEAVPRKYFSGGMSLLVNEKLEYARSSQVPGALDNAQIVTVDLSVFPSDKAMVASDDPLGGYLNGLEGDLVSDNIKLSKAVDPRDQRVLVDLKGLVEFINFIMPFYRIISLDSKVLNDFIERMDHKDNPLVDNRRSDYLYNLLLLTVMSKKKKVWDGWLEKARQGREQESVRTLEKNDVYAVSPVNLELPETLIPLGDGYFLRAKQDSLTVTFKIIKQFQNRSRLIKKNVGILHFGWDDNTSSWVPIAPHGIEINDPYRGRGLAQKAFSRIIDQLGVVRIGITPDEISPSAQRMVERMRAPIEFTGYYPAELKMYRSDSGWSYVMRRDSAQLSDVNTGNTPASGLDRRDFLRLAFFLGASFAFPGFARSAVIPKDTAEDDLPSARKLVLGQLESIGRSGKVPVNIVSMEYWLQVFKSDQRMYLFALDDIETALEAGGYDKGAVDAQLSSKLAIQALTGQTAGAKLKSFFAGSWSRYMISLGNNDRYVSIEKDVIRQRAQDIDPLLGEMVGRLVNNTTDWHNKDIELQWQRFNDTFMIPRGYYATINLDAIKGRKFYFALVYHIESKAKASLPDGQEIDVLTARRADRINFGGDLGHTFNGFKRIFIDMDAIDDEIRGYMSMSPRDMVPYTVIDLKKLSGIKAWLDQFKAKGFEQMEGIVVNSTKKHELGHKIYEGFGITQPVFDGWKGLAPDDIDRIQSEVYAFLSQIKGSQSPGIEIFSLFRFLMTEQSTIEYYVASFILGQMSGQDLDPKHPVAVVQAVDRLLHLSDADLSAKAVLIMDKYYPALNEKAMVNDQKNGGIDLTAAHMDLQTQNESGSIKFHLDPALFDQLQNAPGFVPVIVNIKPMGDLHEFLGISPAAR